MTAIFCEGSKKFVVWISELSTIAAISRRESFRRVGFNRECVTMSVACIKDNLLLQNDRVKSLRE